MAWRVRLLKKIIPRVEGGVVGHTFELSTFFARLLSYGSFYRYFFKNNNCDLN
jgi:hypothetical protein